MRSLIRSPAWRRPMIIAVALALPAISIAAPIDPNPDAVGIYFDQGGISFCATAAPYTMLTGYLLATQVSDPTGISGWQCAVTTDPATLPAGLAIEVFGCPVDCTLPYLNVALPSPVPRAPVIALARLSTFYLGGTIWFNVGACEPTSFPADPGPGYSGGDDPMRLHRLNPAFWGFPDSAHGNSWTVAEINGSILCRITPAAPNSWGAVKSLYR